MDSLLSHFHGILAGLLHCFSVVDAMKRLKQPSRMLRNCAL